MSKIKLDETALGILAGSLIEGNKLTLTCGQLDRPTYQSVNKVLEVLGGKWNRGQKAHLFSSDRRHFREERSYVSAEHAEKLAIEWRQAWLRENGLV